jgi:hypothetical protein
MPNLDINLNGPISVTGLALLHAAAEARLWFGHILSQADGFQSGPLDFTKPQDFYIGSYFLDQAGDKHYNNSGRAFLVIDRNTQVNQKESGFNTSPPVWEKQYLPAPQFDKEARMVVQEGKYYFASGGDWHEIKGDYPYPLINSRNQLKQLRWNISGLLQNTSLFYFVNSGSVQRTDTYIINQDTWFPDYYSPFNLIEDFDGYNLTNIPDRLVNDDNEDFATDNVFSDYLMEYDKVLLSRDSIQELITGIAQARYTFYPLLFLSNDQYNKFVTQGIFDGTETLRVKAHGKLNWIGPKDAYVVSGDTTIPKLRGAIGPNELEVTLQQTYSVSDFAVPGGTNKLDWQFFSGVNLRGPRFTNFDTDSDYAQIVPTYLSLPDPTVFATGGFGNRAYTWDGSDYHGHSLKIEAGDPPSISWQDENLITNDYYRQRLSDKDNIGLQPVTGLGSTATGRLMFQTNLVEVAFSSNVKGPEGTPIVHGFVTFNNWNHGEPSGYQFAKRGESASYPLTDPYLRAVGGGTTNVGFNEIVGIADPRDWGWIFDAFSFIKIK